MRTLHRYVLKEVLIAFLPALLVLVLIMMLGTCVQLLADGLDVVRLRGVPRHIMTMAVPVVLPSALLTGVIIAFGRLSADTEILAIRVAGIHLLHVVVPVLALAVVLSLIGVWFQFQAVPMARVRLEELKEDAIKQILIDQVALSTQRQFSFGGYHVQYGDFQDGEMRDLLVLQVQQGVPTSIATARSGRIEMHPERDDSVRVVLEDCMWLSPDVEEWGGSKLPLPTARKFEIEAKVAEPKARIRARMRHLPLRELLQRLTELREELAAQQSKVDGNPKERERVLRRERNRLRLAMFDVQDALKREMRRLEQSEHGALRNASRAEVTAQELSTLRKDVALLQKQVIAFAQEIRTLQDSNSDDTGTYDKVVELQRNRREVETKLREASDRKQTLLARLGSSQAGAARDAAEAQAARETIANLERELATMQSEYEVFRRTERAVGTQVDLLDLWLRIHKRLVLSVAALSFAMVGIPLGIMTRRRSVMVAFGISFALVLMVFYPFLIFGQIAAESGVLPVGLAMWSGNLTVFVVGIALMAALVRK